MLCQNCGSNEGNVRYTQIINGVKKEMVLCYECAKQMGIEEMDFNMPINFSSFLGDLLEEYNDAFMPSFIKGNTLKCDKCGLTYDEFIESGKFGCENCYESFDKKVNNLVKNLHGSSMHIGRRPKYIKENKIDVNNINVEKENKNESKLEKLNKDLKNAIVEERYEDAAKIRDEIKKIM